MSVIEKLDSVLELVDKATPGEFRPVPVDGLHGYEACLLIERSAVGYVPKDSERQSGIQFYMQDAQAIAAAINYFRDHGPAIRQAMIDARRYRALRDEATSEQIAAFVARRGTRLAADRVCDAAIDARLASDSEGGSDERNE